MNFIERLWSDFEQRIKNLYDEMFSASKAELKSAVDFIQTEVESLIDVKVEMDSLHAKINDLETRLENFVKGTN